MNNAQLKAIGSEQTRGTWCAYDAKGRCVGFDLSEARAKEWARMMGGSAEKR